MEGISRLSTKIDVFVLSHAEVSQKKIPVDEPLSQACSTHSTAEDGWRGTCASDANRANRVSPSTRAESLTDEDIRFTSHH